MTTFIELAEALARENGFGWPIEEDRIAVSSVDFCDARGKHFLTIVAEDANQKSRAFLDANLNPNLLLGSESCIRLDETDFYELIELGEVFFDEFWGEDLSETHHPFIYGLREGCTAVVHLKENGRDIRANRST